LAQERRELARWHPKGAASLGQDAPALRTGASVCVGGHPAVRARAPVSQRRPAGPDTQAEAAVAQMAAELVESASPMGPSRSEESRRSCLKAKRIAEQLAQDRTDAHGNPITKGGIYAVSFRDHATQKSVSDVKEVTAYKNSYIGDYDGESQRCTCAVM